MLEMVANVDSEDHPAVHKILSRDANALWVADAIVLTCYHSFAVFLKSKFSIESLNLAMA